MIDEPINPLASIVVPAGCQVTGAAYASSGIARFAGAAMRMPSNKRLRTAMAFRPTNAW
jgi:hypothetical protein